MQPGVHPTTKFGGDVHMIFFNFKKNAFRKLRPFAYQKLWLFSTFCTINIWITYAIDKLNYDYFDFCEED